MSGTDAAAPDLGLEPVATVSTAAEVVQQLERLIIEGRLRPGDQLPSELQLAQGLQVARSTVREAKHALVGRGLVELRGTRGAFVSERANERSAVTRALEVLASSMESDLYEARLAIEGAAAELAAVRASSFDLNGLGDLLQDIATEAASGSSNQAIHLRFHTAIVAASKNQVLVALYTQIAHIIENQHGPSYRMISDTDREIRSHWELLEALQSRDPSTAAKAMHAHLDNVELRRQSAIRGGLHQSDLEP